MLLKKLTFLKIHHFQKELVVSFNLLFCYNKKYEN